MKKPVTVVTGFLGSGKTTLLSKALSGAVMKNTAVLVNEFGEVGLDHHLLRRVGERTVLLGSGCVCCTRREDLVGALGELLDLEERGEIPALDRVIIETTGLADPAPILHTVFNDPVLQHHFFVDLVISTVDAVNGELHLERNPESVRQLAAADKVFLTKTDLADPRATRDLLSKLRTINPTATLAEIRPEDAAPKNLFDPECSPSVARVLEYEPHPHGGAGADSISLTFDGPVDWAGFGIWLSMLLHSHGEEVLRVKGLLDVGAPGPVILNGVQHTIHPPQHLDAWPDGDHDSRIIFITRGVHPDGILSSLQAFGRVTGASPRRTTGRVSTAPEVAASGLPG